MPLFCNSELAAHLPYLKGGGSSASGVSNVEFLPSYHLNHCSLPPPTCYSFPLLQCRRALAMKEREERFLQTALRGAALPTGWGSPSEAQRFLDCCWCGVGLPGHARAPGTRQRRSPGTAPSFSRERLSGLASPYTMRARLRIRNYRRRRLQRFSKKSRDGDRLFIYSMTITSNTYERRSSRSTIIESTKQIK